MWLLGSWLTGQKIMPTFENLYTLVIFILLPNSTYNVPFLLPHLTSWAPSLFLILLLPPGTQYKTYGVQVVLDDCSWEWPFHWGRLTVPSSSYKVSSFSDGNGISCLPPFLHAGVMSGLGVGRPCGCCPVVPGKHCVFEAIHHFCSLQSCCLPFYVNTCAQTEGYDTNT